MALSLPMLRRRPLRALAAVLAVTLTSPSLRACGGEDYGPVYAPQTNPPLPLTGLLDGHLGLIEREWSPVFLIAAYRSAAPIGWSDAEREAFVQRVATVWNSVPATTFSPSLTTFSVGSPDAASAQWLAARAELGLPSVALTNGYTHAYQWVTNCLDDAFVRAAATLRARVAADGPASPSVRAWVTAQDAVFSNCGAAPGTTPAPLPPAAAASERREREYQIASAEFYAGAHPEAERDFRRIAADPDAPMAATARYMVVRTIVREAQRDRDTPDPSALDRALHEADTVLADPAFAAVHPMTARYRGWIQHLRNPLAQGHFAASGIARDRLDDRFDEALTDFIDALDHRQDALFRPVAGDPDALSTFVAVLRRASAALGAPAVRVGMDQARTTHRPLWLVAALLAVEDVRATEVPELLRLAAAVPRSDPAYVSAQFHRLRIAAERRAPGVHAEVIAFEHTLRPDDGPFARNRVRELAAQTAPALDAFLAEAHGLPAGWMEGETLITPPPQAAPTLTDVLSPLGEQVLHAGVPLSVLVRASRATALPTALRSRVMQAAMVRAALLDDALTFESLRRAVRTDLPRESPLAALADATSPATMRYELLRAMLDHGADQMLLSPLIDARPDRAWLTERCGDLAPETFAPASFLTAAERREFVAERARVLGLGDRRAFIADALAALYPSLGRDPTYPAALHRAVIATRANGCPPRAAVHAASRRAFEVLHRRFAQHPSTIATPYWY